MNVVIFGLVADGFATPLLVGLALGVALTLAAGFVDRRRH